MPSDTSTKEDLQFTVDEFNDILQKYGLSVRLLQAALVDDAADVRLVGVAAYYIWLEDNNLISNDTADERLFREDRNKVFSLVAKARESRKARIVSARCGRICGRPAVAISRARGCSVCEEHNDEEREDSAKTH